MTLLDRVRREARALTWRSRSVHALAALAVLLLVVALGAWVLTDGRWLRWPRGIPLLVWGVGSALAALAFRVTGARVPVPPSAEGLAHGIEREQGLRAGSLRGALEIGGDGVLGARAVADLESRLGPGEVLLPAARRRASRSLAGGVLVAFVALVVTGVVSAKARDGLAAVLHPLDAWRGRLLPALAFEGLPTEMPRGMPLTLRVRAVGRTTVAVSLRSAGEGWRTDTLVVDPATSLATYDVGAMRAPLTVRADDGRAPVLEQEIAVGDRGWIGDVQVEAVYPAYLARPTERLEWTGGVRVPRGTELRVQAAVYAGARDVQLIGTTRDRVRFDALGSRVIAARLDVQGDAQWRWQADATPGVDGVALPVELPEPLIVQMVADEKPVVEILAPQNDTTVSSSGEVLLAIGANDDHGLATVSLLVQRERANGSKDAPVRIPLASLDTPLWDGGYALALEGRTLEAGDRLVVVAQAVDASPWRQLSESRRLVLRIPTAEEQRQLARALADSLMARADAITEAERALQRSTSDAAKSRELQGGARTSTNPSPSDGAKGSSMSYESAEKMKAMAQQQRDLGDRVEQLKDGARELEQRLSESGAMDKALSDRFNELQKMLRDAMTPEMQQKLAQLEQASDRLSGSEVRQSLEQLAEQQRQMREQLEKSAEMLKRAALEGAMETLRDEASELAEAERTLSEALRKPSGPPQQGQGREQAGSASPQVARDLASRAERLEREVQQLTEKLRQEGAQAGASKAQEAQPDVGASRDAMRQAAEQLRAQPQGQPQGQPGQPQGQPQGQPGQQGQQPGQPQGRPPQGRPPQGGPPQAGQQGGQPQPGPPQAGQPGGQPQAGQPQAGQPGGGSPQNRQGAADQAQRAAESMERAAEQLAAAREAQVDAWKQDLSQQLDQTINETAQLARQQQQLADRAQQDGFPQGMQGEQGALQQGVQQAAERLEEAARGSALLSQRSQRAMAEAQQRVQQATQAAGAAGQPGGSAQAQGAMRDAAQALNQALASLVRDRERVNNANSASGFGEMLEQMKELAQQQGSLNGQMQGLQMMPGGPQGQQAQQQARAIARQQRSVADGLQDVADIDPTGRLEALAREAQQVAQALDRGGLDPSTAARQQQLYRRMLDAGRFMEQEERDDQGPRESRAGDGRGTTRASGVMSGRDGVRFAPPTWSELRSLSADERRLVYEYFRRLNGSPP